MQTSYFVAALAGLLLSTATEVLCAADIRRDDILRMPRRWTRAP